MNNRVRRIPVVGNGSAGYLYTIRVQRLKYLPSWRPDRPYQRVLGLGLRLRRLRRWGPRLATEPGGVKALPVCNIGRRSEWRRQEKVR